AGHVIARANLDLFRLLLELGDECVAGATDGDDGRDRHAPLPGGTVASRGDVIRGEVHVGVGQHDGMILRAAERLHAFAAVGSALVDVFGDRRGSNEGHGGDAGMVEYRVYGHLVTVHYVEHALGQSGIRVKLGNEVRRRWVALARLEQERVARSDRDGMHPHRDHGRKVERCDAGAHAERLAEREGIYVGGYLFGVLTLEQLRDPAGELHDLHAADHLALGIGLHLAVLSADDLRQLVEVLVDQLPEGEHDPGAAGERDVEPALERLAGNLDHSVHVGYLGEQDLRLDLAGCWIPDVRSAGGGSDIRRAADPVLNRGHGPNSLLTHKYCRCFRLCSRYTPYASLVLSMAATSETGTSHQLSDDGTGANGSVSTYTTVVRSACLAWTSADRNSSMVDVRSTSAPRLCAFAARSTGSLSPSSIPVSGLR